MEKYPRYFLLANILYTAVFFISISFIGPLITFIPGSWSLIILLLLFVPFVLMILYFFDGFVPALHEKDKILRIITTVLIVISSLFMVMILFLL